MFRDRKKNILIFSLKALNSRAEKVIDHRYNLDITSSKFHGERCFTFASLDPTKHSNKIMTIATMGSSRSKADAYDDSSGRTRVYQDNRPSNISNMSGATRSRAIIMEGVNTVLSLGSRDNPVRFEILWNLDPDKILEIVRQRISEASESQRRELHEFTDQTHWKVVPNPIRHVPLVELGMGAFGMVMKTADAYSGGVMAVKLLHRPKNQKDPRWIDTLITARDREMFILSKLNHGHIVEYLGSQGWDTGLVEIFMPMKKGTLCGLIRRYPSYDSSQKYGKIVLVQLLSALDYLAAHKLIHRDIKPDNILYDVTAKPDGDERHIFQLADFGLSALQDLARSQAGTMVFMAPEVYDGTKAQTPRADIWSLYVTLLWVHNEDMFRHRVETGRLYRQTDVRRAVLDIASRSKDLRFMRGMAIYDPALRASAAQVLKGLKREDLMTHADAAPTHSFSQWMADVKAGKSKYSPYLTKILE
ncbi:kinase-like protein [Daldinia caldariorum]|uniref:kinase-like protein n=1 Tax=Daldinia caldariorum TaxID=326644 RepID=UPI0020075252|nr:kinase-like protein [Daldinia caldariorum]KAI1468354.1 kinase-like protein [Daldinia caldariorum]